MKKTYEQLPDPKKDELRYVVSAIQEKCDDVEMIILFGSYARGDYKTEGDLVPDRKSGHVSDYDVLVVTGTTAIANDTKLWDKVTEACNTPKLSAHARIIVHDIQELNILLAEGQYFFSDIKKEGITLFDSGRFELADTRELSAEERQRIAQDHFNHWFDKAGVFFEDYQLNINKKPEAMKYLTQAAFNLHQAVEAAYKAIILVFTNYNPNEHWLAALSDLVIEQDNTFEGLFPNKTSEEKDRLMLLDYAYIGARYDPKYRISKSDLEILAVSVKKLLELTETTCVKKIAAFTAGD